MKANLEIIIELQNRMRERERNVLALRKMIREIEIDFKNGNYPRIEIVAIHNNVEVYLNPRCDESEIIAQMEILHGYQSERLEELQKEFNRFSIVKVPTKKQSRFCKLFDFFIK
jgi:hypothetical protein